MGGLEAVVYLAKGAKVMLAMNLWTDVGLCNGALGSVIDFLYSKTQRPPCLPVCVLVQFDGEYKGPSASTIPNLVSICMARYQGQNKKGRCVVMNLKSYVPCHLILQT